MRDAMSGVAGPGKQEDLLLKIGIHEGPCLAVMLNERQDYFGQTVNIASRVQNLALSRAILATEAVVDYPETAKLLEGTGLKPTAHRAALKGVSEEVRLYEIP
jgi:class 3 adenylate cyclase